MAKCHPKYGNFEKSGSISENAAHRAKISFILTPHGRKRVYWQIQELLAMAKFLGKIGQVFRKTAVRRAKMRSISTLWGSREYMCNFWNFCQWPSIMPECGKFRKSASIWETAVHRVKISSISTPWGRKQVYGELLPMAKFHAQMYDCGNFENQPIS